MFEREPVKTNIIPIDRVLAEENRQAREQWEAARAARALRERQDEALRYLALKQWQRDQRPWNRFMQWLRSNT